MPADNLRLTLSSTELLSLAQVGTVPGVRIVAAAGRNSPGAGRLMYSAAGEAWPATLAWMAPGSIEPGPAAVIAGDGEYLVEDLDASKWLRVQVYEDYLLATACAAQVILADRYKNGIAGADLLAGAAAAAAQLTVENAGQETIHAVIAWLDDYAEHVEISLDGATWSSPTTEAAGLQIGDLAPAGSAALHIRRTAPAGHGPEPSLLVLIHFSFNTV